MLLLELKPPGDGNSNKPRLDQASTFAYTSYLNFLCSWCTRILHNCICISYSLPIGNFPLHIELSNGIICSLKYVYIYCN